MNGEDRGRPKCGGMGKLSDGCVLAHLLLQLAFFVDAYHHKHIEIICCLQTLVRRHELSQQLNNSLNVFLGLSMLINNSTNKTCDKSSVSEPSSFVSEPKTFV